MAKLLLLIITVPLLITTNLLLLLLSLMLPLLPPLLPRLRSPGRTTRIKQSFFRMGSKFRYRSAVDWDRNCYDVLGYDVLGP